MLCSVGIQPGTRSEFLFHVDRQSSSNEESVDAADELEMAARIIPVGKYWSVCQVNKGQLIIQQRNMDGFLGENSDAQSKDDAMTENQILLYGSWFGSGFHFLPRTGQKQLVVTESTRVSNV